MPNYIMVCNSILCLNTWLKVRYLDTGPKGRQNNWYSKTRLSGTIQTGFCGLQLYLDMESFHTWQALWARCQSSRHRTWLRTWNNLQLLERSTWSGIELRPEPHTRLLWSIWIEKKFGFLIEENRTPEILTFGQFKKLKFWSKWAAILNLDNRKPDLISSLFRSYSKPQPFGNRTGS